MPVVDYEAKVEQMADALRRLEPLSAAEPEQLSALLAAINRVCNELEAEARKAGIGRAERAAYMSLFVKVSQLLIVGQRAWIDARMARWNEHRDGTETGSE